MGGHRGPRGRRHDRAAAKQRLEEADQLGQHIVVIDRGTVIEHGTSNAVKTQVGGDRLEIVVRSGSSLEDAVTALREVPDGDGTADADTRRITATVSGGSTVRVDAVRVLDGTGVAIDDLALRRPTLDEVFLSLTDRGVEPDLVARARLSPAVRQPDRHPLRRVVVAAPRTYTVICRTVVITVFAPLAYGTTAAPPADAPTGPRAATAPPVEGGVPMSFVKRLSLIHI